MSSSQSPSIFSIGAPKSSPNLSSNSGWASDNDAGSSCPYSPGSSLSRTSSIVSFTSSTHIGAHSKATIQYPIEQLLLLASSPLVDAERRHVSSALGRLGLPEIRKPKAKKAPRQSRKANVSSTSPSRGRSTATATATSTVATSTAPIPIPTRATASDRHQRHMSHSGSESGRSSGSWKHSWNEVAALQTWRRS
ncbi:hypothetical protein FRB97_000654 [Tulasnella sp. 331]|nr:hypothetical protein FRB97_000654 [Tulasnella sp. 331]